MSSRRVPRAGLMRGRFSERAGGTGSALAEVQRDTTNITTGLGGRNSFTQYVLDPESIPSVSSQTLK